MEGRQRGAQTAPSDQGASAQEAAAAKEKPWARSSKVAALVLPKHA